MRMIVLAALVALGACAPEEKSQVANEARPVYVDVRTEAEFNAGHVAGAINIPAEQMTNRWQELVPYRDREMVVYCRTGRRSAAALEVLHAQGFTQAVNGGGFDALVAKGVDAAQ